MKSFLIILGGMGTLATESYVRLLNKKTETHKDQDLSLIHISEPTRRTPISYAVFCLKKKNQDIGVSQAGYAV